MTSSDEKQQKPMSAEDFATKAGENDIEAIYRCLKDEGIISDSSPENGHALSRDMFGIFMEIRENRVQHTTSSSWSYKGYSAEELTKMIECRMAIDALHLRACGIKDRLTIHEWCESYSFVMVLSISRNGYEQVVESVSFSNLNMEHFELIGFDYRYMVPRKIVDLCEEVAGFRAFPMHCFESFITVAGYLDKMTEDGVFCADKVNDTTIDAPASIVLASDKIGMDMLKFASVHTPADLID